MSVRCGLSELVKPLDGALHHDYQRTVWLSQHRSLEPSQCYQSNLFSLVWLLSICLFLFLSVLLMKLVFLFNAHEFTLCLLGKNVGEKRNVPFTIWEEQLSASHSEGNTKEVLATAWSSLQTGWRYVMKEKGITKTRDTFLVLHMSY